MLTIIKGWGNLIEFIFYFFSLDILAKTLFSPWKRYSWKKTKPGFHPTEIFFIAVSNVISRIIGFFLRVPTIIIGLFAGIVVLYLGLPISALLYILDSDSIIFKRKDLHSVRPLAGDWHFGYTPSIDPYAVDLYFEKDEATIPLIGRENEIEEIIGSLSQKGINNILLVGTSGSGRHALIRHVAQTIVNVRFLDFNYISFLKDKNTKSEKQGAFEEILKEAEHAGNVVLVFDQFEQMDELINVVTNFLERGKIQIVGITDPASYHKVLLPNAELMKFFSRIEINPLSKDQVMEVLKKRMAILHEVSLEDKILQNILEASFQLQAMEDKHQPEAAIDLLDEFAAFYRTKKKGEIDELLDQFLSQRLKIPHGAISFNQKEKLKNLENLIHQRIIDQDEAVKQVASALKRKKLDLSNPDKPIGSFLFLGPTGVGKTETAKALAAIFFESEDKLMRFDMASYQQRQQTVDFSFDLAQAIRDNPYGVLLLDEIEKANRDLLNFLLTIIDEGYFQDRNKTKVLCNNLIIIGTSNAGAEFIRENLKADEKAIVEYLLKNNLFSPEFINRFDSVIVFKPLTNEHLKKIAEMKIEKLKKQVEEKHDKTFEITNDLLEQIVAEGAHPEFGAREIDRTIKKLVEDKIAEELLE